MMISSPSLSGMNKRFAMMSPSPIDETIHSFKHLRNSGNSSSPVLDIKSYGRKKRIAKESKMKKRQEKKNSTKKKKNMKLIRGFDIRESQEINDMIRRFVKDPNMKR